jgi:hypothetical protein
VVQSVPKGLDAPSQEPRLERGKRSLDRGSFWRAAFATRHRPHLQSGAHYASHFGPKKAEQARLSFPDTLLPAVSGDALEIDELVIRYRFKRRYKYLWIAISRLTHMVITHQVIGFWIGNRSFKCLWEFWFTLPAGYRKKLVYKVGLQRFLRSLFRVVRGVAAPAL